MSWKNFIDSLKRQKHPEALPVMFTGERRRGRVYVCLDDVMIDLRSDLRPGLWSDFEWGSACLGAEQLAVAMLAAIYPDEVALVLWRDFTRQAVLGFPHERWLFSVDSLDHWLRVWLRQADLGESRERPKEVKKEE